MIASFMHWLGYGLCHQLPERSFASGGYQVPVCARDTGIYLGFVVSFGLLWLMSRGKRPAELPRWPVLALAVAFIGAMAFDGVTSYAGLRGTTNDIRLLTGLMTGFAMPVLLVPILNGQLWRDPGRGRVPDGGRQILLWLVALPIAFVVVRWPFEWFGIVYPLLVSAAIIVTFTMVNLAIVSVLPAVEGRAGRLKDVWPWILAALVLSAAEISAAAWVRVIVTRIAS